ncbi:cell envelope integrity protein TolA [Paraurantiacibacter namhicola]|uniref:Uncharacterized protein n=1 Tax=Paraurantiacibacter namhicola TaxID=645517 RepID=A0A1C7D7M6_9SPHN|nr:cell envelope integrity protein TolA [Paraurantiacibacter namhicola]ANU07303.1 hypothetical protein A6F65_00993 [Paraurantiacibacter namhicola]
MAQTATFQPSEWAGLTVAIGAHVALGIALYIAAQTEPAAISVPDRMVVSLAEDVALESTAPDPSAAPAAAIAPVLAPVSAPVTEPAVQPVTEPVPRPQPQPPRTATRPNTRSTPKPRSTPARSAPTPAPRPTPSARTGGGSRLGADFLPGESDGDRSTSRGTPAATFGPREAASLNAAIGRQIKPHWSAPQGPDAEKLVTIVRFRLDKNGRLSGNPSCVDQSGVTPSNSAQSDLHCERAIRAVRLAAPFDLPEEFYDQWKLINSRFDRRL